MRFLVDAQLPPRLCDWLRQRGHGAVHVADIDLVGATDARIADRAIRESLAVISKDEDFLTLRMPDRFSLVWLRVGNASNRALYIWLTPRWPTIEAMLKRGERLIEVR